MGNKLGDDEYICSACGKTYKKGWSDEEALEEAKAIWGDSRLETDQVVICDDCFNKGLSIIFGG